MAKGFALATRLTLTGAVEAVRAPTQDELWDLDRQLGEWQLQQTLSSPAGGLPPELHFGLQQLIAWQIVQQLWTRRQILLMSWSYVCEGVKRYGWGGSAYKYAANMLKGSPAEAGPEMMKKRYIKMQGKLPPAQRRPRTYRRPGTPLG
jgi:hypothetical protein